MLNAISLPPRCEVSVPVNVEAVFKPLTYKVCSLHHTVATELVKIRHPCMADIFAPLADSSPKNTLKEIIMLNPPLMKRVPEAHRYVTELRHEEWRSLSQMKTDLTRKEEMANLLPSIPSPSFPGQFKSIFGTLCKFKRPLMEEIDITHEACSDCWFTLKLDFFSVPRRHNISNSCVMFHDSCPECLYWIFFVALCT